AGAAIGVDGLALDELGGQPGNAVVGGTPVVQGGDVGVLHAGERAALEAQALALVVGGAEAEKFERDRAVELVVAALGVEDQAGAAAAELADGAVTADFGAGGHAVGEALGRETGLGRNGGGRGPRAVVGREQ